MPAPVWPSARRVWQPDGESGVVERDGSRNDWAKARKILSRLHALERLILALAAPLALVIAGCSGNPPAPSMPPVDQLTAGPGPDYIIGPGDTIQVFVWRNPELTVNVPVRP